MYEAMIDSSVLRFVCLTTQNSQPVLDASDKYVEIWCFLYPGKREHFFIWNSVSTVPVAAVYFYISFLKAIVTCPSTTSVCNCNFEFCGDLIGEVQISTDQFSTMVSSLLSPLSEKLNVKNPFQNQLLTPITETSKVLVPRDCVELGFSDVFGPIPVQTQIELTTDDDSHSQSLIGPPDLPSQSISVKHGSVRTSDSVNQLVEEICEDVVEGLEDCDDSESVKSNKHSNDLPTKRPRHVGVEDFEFLRLIGKGASGKVYQVKMKGTSEIYAMKVVRKDRIVQKDHAKYIMSERDILAKVDHPFVVRLRYSFQNKYRLYLVMNFINGGHLFFQLRFQGLFREDLGRLYAAEIVSAVSHLHDNGIMHRDLKPENVLLGEDGHVVLTDFGLANNFVETERSYSFCGTLGYMSPEVLLSKGHDKATDWWSVGILIFEMLTGRPPFRAGNRQKMQEKIMKEKINLPPYLSQEAHSLLKGLLQKEVGKRLGSGPDGGEEVKRHEWFRPIDWKKLEARQIRPTFLPKVNGAQCIANFDVRYTRMPVIDSPPGTPIYADDNHSPFKGFSFLRSPM